MKKTGIRGWIRMLSLGLSETGRLDDVIQVEDIREDQRLQIGQTWALVVWEECWHVW